MFLAALLVLPAPAPAAADPIRVGMEYILLDDSSHLSLMAGQLAGIGAPAAKAYPEHIEWGAMQRAPGSAVDYRRLDAFVREFQARGFTDLVVCLRSNCRWASRHYSRLGSKNPAPKPAHAAAYEAWIAGVVERYDGDGAADMPGLLHPVRLYEIGSEFSTYEPEPVADYLGMLARAYRVAHRAFPGVQVAHAAFLATNAFRSDPSPAQYEAAFAAVDRRILRHGLADMRAVLDRPGLFDVVNVHSLGAPSEIEPLCRWLRYEMERRKYSKPILISDTTPWPFIAWGPATVCDAPAALMGVLVAPAREADRCRLARYFSYLVDRNPKYINWTQRFTAADMVKRVVLAAAEGVTLINTAFVEDLGWLKLKPFQAGAGTSAWSGFIDPERPKKRAGYFALQQLLRQLDGYESIRRVPQPDPRLRMYEVRKPSATTWVVWLDPDTLWLPLDALPSAQVELEVGTARCAVESADLGPSFLGLTATPVPTAAGSIRVTATPDPTYVTQVR